MRNCPRLGTFKTNSLLPTRKSGGRKLGLCFAMFVCFDVSRAVGIARFESVSESQPHRTIQCHYKVGKIQRGAHKRGLKPQIFRENRGEILPRKSGLFGAIGAISGLAGAFSGPIGTNSSAPHSHGGRAEVASKGPFLARLAPFGLSPPLLSPRLDFPDKGPAPGYSFRTLLGRPCGGRGRSPNSPSRIPLASYRLEMSPK